MQYHILHNILHVFLLHTERELRKHGFKGLKQSANLDYLLLFKDLLKQNLQSDRSLKNDVAELCIFEKQLHEATSLLDKTPKHLIDERVFL